MKITELKTKEPFCSLFPVIRPEALSAIKEDMEMNGYDQAYPIIIWDNVIIDGHTRVKAAEQAGITEIPVFAYDFDNELDAIQYAIHNQRNRRDRTDVDWLRLNDIVDQVRKKGENLKEYPRNEKGRTIKPGNINPNNTGIPSHQQTAQILGISPSKVQEIRAVASDPEAREAVESGTKSIHRAAQEVREKKKQEKEFKPRSTFNQAPSKIPCKTCGKTDEESIEWAKQTWNPVTGCQYGCVYCYARDIANRFYPPEIGFTPHFWPERLAAPKNTKAPISENILDKIVFTCSMADLFGEWVPQEWIDSVMKAVREAPEWTFLFLTKNPKRYLTIDFPPNVWIGSTADTQARADEALDVFFGLGIANAGIGKRPPILFLSIEPMRERIDLSREEHIHAGSISLIEIVDWIIIGGQSQSSGAPAMQPKWEWVEEVFALAREKNIPIYFKPNLTTRPKEYPNQ